MFNALRCLVLALGEAVKRREFITLIGSSAAAWPLPARAQELARSYRVAYLALVGDQDALIVKKRLDELGYSEGKNLVFDLRFKRDIERSQGMHGETVALTDRRRRMCPVPMEL